MLGGEKIVDYRDYSGDNDDKVWVITVRDIPLKERDEHWEEDWAQHPNDIENKYWLEPYIFNGQDEQDITWFDWMAGSEQGFIDRASGSTVQARDMWSNFQRHWDSLENPKYEDLLGVHLVMKGSLATVLYGQSILE